MRYLAMVGVLAGILVVGGCGGDSTGGRFATGDEAVIYHESRPTMVYFERGRREENELATVGGLTMGTRVRVVADEGQTPLPKDDKGVVVTVLDGPVAGHTGTLSRDYLKLTK